MIWRLFLTVAACGISLLLAAWPSASRDRPVDEMRVVAPADIERMRYHGVDMFLEDAVTGEKYFIRAGLRCTL